jgi:hypothetical protein
MTALAFSAAACGKAEVVERNIEMYGYDGKTDELRLDNEFLELRFIPETASVILTDKATGAVWRTNPENAAEDLAADGITKQLMQSQLSVTYADSTGAGMSLNSFKYSVDKSMYEYAVIDNGIEVSYTIGDIVRVYIIPNALPEWRMAELTGAMDSAAKRSVEDNYRLYDINRLRSTDDKAALLEAYPTLAEEKIWIMRDTVQDFMKEKLEETFADAGYTEDDYRGDMERYGVYTQVEKPMFNVTLRYELDADSLLVSVPFDKISYSNNYPITYLNVLPFFGAGSTDDEGYLFVPDGSGALIYFNNGRETQLAYNVNIYGWDECVRRNLIVNDEKAAFPVFGIKKNENTLLCVIEEGSSYASIGADVSGRNCSYNSVSAAFSMLHSASMDISSKSDRAVILYENGLPEGERIAERFTPCKEDGYVGMAKEYRGYLEQKYPSRNELPNGGVPIAVEIIGAVDKTQTRFGMPFDLPLKLTTYREAEGMVSDFADMGWTDVQIKLLGWFNGGVQHSVPVNIKPVPELGSAKDLKSLVSAAKNNGFDFYAEGDFLFMRDNSLFDGFSLNSDAARYVSRERVESYPYSFVWFGERKRWGKLSYLARPDYMMDLIDGFAGKISEYGADGIAFRTMGSRLASDYDEKRRTSRERTKNLQSAKLSELSDKGVKTMVSTGNVYAAAHADFITDLPLTDQSFGITDVAVPFYGIVLHGRIPYAGEAINLSEDYRLNLLKTAENGAGLYFSFMTEETAVLQETNFRQFYSNEYAKWISDADALYKQFAADFGGLYNKTIEGHEILDKNVAVTVYEDGTKVYTNANNYDYDRNGMTIPAFGYKVAR